MDIMKVAKELSPNNGGLMKKYIDLHMHSTYSDGRYEPKKLIEEAKRNGVGTISITDHDTIDAYYDPLIKNDDDITIVKGIEVSSLYTARNGKSNRIHILGYNLDHSNKKLLEVLDNMKDMRTDVNKKYLASVIDRYRFLPESITETVDCEKYYRIGWAILEVLKISGISEEEYKQVKKYIWSNFPNYPGYDVHYKKVIETIHDAGGIPVIAHPYSYRLNDLDVKRMIRDLMDAGIEGIEVYHSECPRDKMIRLKMLANNYKLLYSCGSDFHFPTEIDNKIIGHGIDENLCHTECSVLDKVLKLERK